MAMLDKGEVPIGAALPTVLSQVPRKGLVLALLSCPTFRDQDTDTWTKKRGVHQWEDSGAYPWHGTSSSSEYGTITELSRVGPQTTETSFCLAAGGTSAGMVRKVATVTSTRSQTCPSASLPCCFLLLVRSLLWG